MSEPAFVILAEGELGLEASKTAASAIRYLPERVTAVVDSTRSGRTVGEVLGIGGQIPIVASVEEALACRPVPGALLVGIAPQGGVLPSAWRPPLEAALEAGLEIWSGLHTFLSEDPDLRVRADRRGVAIRDLRKPPRDLPVATGRAMDVPAYRVLTVGTDCNVGKMTTSLELRAALREQGVRAAFAATGQTGILIEGRGIAVDAVVSDFVAGAAERLVLEAAEDADLVLVEGQGSLLHPGYSGVTLGLLHGTAPQAMVLCDRPSRETIYGGNYDWVKVPPLEEVVAIYEEAASWIQPRAAARVVGICRATFDLSETEAQRVIDEARERTGLPVTDPVRFGVDELAQAIVRVGA